ncbi:DNA-processing protein DprA [Rathayibacter sp. VKM Ac-2760]|uniref:DNA-processing protein DprA n=1 Tax=Rathayibacter sp. VKM Ac-2760 TaxID=2609253 RepID=UPI0013189AA6|nr:DNA-processing protein DprA [Rathayibacter sp. VKM Ac-2760]QHC59083.1 DNA-protecting protein DprA [Rathayibacter sp. VKM Ac-2760]
MIAVAELFDRVELRSARRLLPEGSESDPVEALARAAWSSLAEPGDAVAGTLIERFGAGGALAQVVGSASAGDVLAEASGAGSYRLSGGPSDAARGSSGPVDVPSDPASEEEEDSDPHLGARVLAAGLARWRPRVDRALLARRLEIAQRLDAQLLVPDSDGWPPSLADLGPHSPFLLWSRGDPLALITPHRLAVVGARAATGYGEHVAADLAAGTAERGVLVVSGAAFGIDAVAHKAALGAGGRTVAFLAGGSDRLYPTAHTDLLHRIIATPGCSVVTEVPPGTTPTRWRFLQRNRLIAASTAATVVVEAGARSGSLNTAGHAAALGRPLGSVPGPVTSASSAGCHRLLREYAATCVTSATEVVELLGMSDVLATAPDARRVAARVLDVLRGEGAHETEVLAQRSGMSIPETLDMLGTCLANGFVDREADGRWRLAAR